MTSQLPLGLRTADVVGAAVTGLLTLPDPARRSPVGRFALRTTVAGFTGATVWVGLGEDPELRTDLARRAGFTAGVVGLAYGAAELGERLDALTQRTLVRWGVRRPRAVMAVAGAGLALVMAVVDRRAENAAAASGTAGAATGETPDAAPPAH
ncbi:hypothetical protein FHE66_03270 [Georgenia sp. 311]|uniref:hypothetical protein n=1 Tax=Georgenia sp. 311 TaxID=2585134 RepID=UPI0011123CAE|nr:hypothetical protein [Georgenia sp. 311]TNC19500.1 hypothetical protein FHE66_03270 [Georgenia sp. 311]